MSELSDLLDRMRVHASVAGGAITGELHDHDQVDVSFAPGFYARSTDATLEQHLVSLARLMRAEYVRQYYAAVSTAFGRTITKDPPPIGPRDMDYAEQRQDLVAEGKSGSGRITISVRGMQAWRMRIAPGTVRTLDEKQFIEQFREAATALIRNQFAGIRSLKTASTAESYREGVVTPTRRYRPVPWAMAMCVSLAVAVSGCTPDSSPTPHTSACSVPTAAPDGTEAPANQAPGGGGLQLIDHGYTQVGGNAYVSLGALVRNTSSQIAYRTAVTLRVSDAQGHTAVDPLNAAQLILEIPVIRPGQQVAVGSSAGLRTDLSLSGAPDKVARFDVVLGSTLWLPASDATLFPSFATTYRGIDRNDVQPATGAVHYAVASTSLPPAGVERHLCGLRQPGRRGRGRCV